MPFEIQNFDDLSIPFADRGTPTVIDMAISLPQGFDPSDVNLLTLSGLMAGDTIGFAAGSPLTVNNGVLSDQFGILGSVGQANGQFVVSFNQGFLAVGLRLEQLIEALTFSTTDGATSATRNLTLTVETPVNTATGDTTITIFDPGFDLAGLDGLTVGEDAARSPVILDGSVDFTVSTATFQNGSVVLSGLAEGDVAGIFTGASSLFSLDGSTLFYSLGARPIVVGNVSFAQGSMTVFFPGDVGVEVIDNLIQNLTIANPTGTGPVTRDITVTVTDSLGVSDAQSATVRILPGIDGLRDILRVDSSTQNISVLIDTDIAPVQAGDYADGQLTVSGLGEFDSVSPSGNGLTNIPFDETSGELAFDGATFASYQRVDAGGGLFTFQIDFGTLNPVDAALVERVIEALLFTSEALAPSRDLTFTLGTAGGPVRMDTVTVLSSDPYTLENLVSEVVISPADAATGAVIDADVDFYLAVGAPSAFLGISGLRDGDFIGINQGLGSPYTVVNDQILDAGTGTFVAEIFTAPGRVEINLGSHVDREATLDSLIQNLTFGSTAVTPDETRQLTLSINGLGNTIGTVDVHIVPDGAVQLFGVSASALFGSVSIATQPQVIDSDVSVRLNGFDTQDATIQVRNLALGDAVTLRLEGDGPGEFAVDGATLRYEGQAIGTYMPGSASGIAPPSNFVVTLGAGVPAAVIEALIEHIQYANAAADLRAPSPLTIVINDATGHTVAGREVGISLVAGLDTLKEAVGYDIATAAIAQHIDTTVTIPETDPLSTFGGSLTVTGLVAGDEIGLNAPPSSNIMLIDDALVLGSSRIGTFTRSEGQIVFAFNNGTGRGNVETVLNALTFRNTAETPAAERDLTITLVNGAGTTVSQNVVAVTIGDATFTDVAPTVTIPAGITATVLDSDITLNIPEGLDFNGAALMVRGVATENEVLSIVLEEGGALNTIENTIFFNGLAVGTFFGGTAQRVQELLIETPLVVTLNSNATVAAVEAIAEAIGLATGTDPAPAGRDLRLSLIAGRDTATPTVIAEAKIAVTVTPPLIEGLNDRADYILGNSLLRLDDDVTIPAATYNGTTITVSGLETGDRLGVVDFNPFDLRLVPSDVIENGGFIDRSTFGGTIRLGTWTGGNGADLVLQLDASFNISQISVEAILESLGFSTTNPDPSRTLGITLTNGANVVSRDTITVTVDAPGAVITGLAEAVTFSPAQAAMSQVLDADVSFAAPFRDYDGGTLTVSGAAAGDIISIRHDSGAPFAINGSTLTENGNPIGTLGTTPDGAFEISFTGATDAALIERLIENLIFFAGPGAPVTRDLTITATDSDNETASGTITVRVANPPEIADLANSIRILPADAATPRAIDSDVTFTAPDSSFDGGTLLVRGGVMGDSLSILHGSSPTEGFQETPDSIGNVLRHGASGNEVGLVNYGPGGIAFTFNANATAAMIDELIQSIAFASTAVPPVPTRDITFTLTDSFGTSVTETVRIDIVEPNERALNYTVLVGDADPAPIVQPGVAAAGVAYDLDPASLFGTTAAPDTFLVSYTGLIDTNKGGPNDRTIITLDGPAGMMLRVDGVLVMPDEAGMAALDLSPGLHRIELLVPHSAAGGAVTSAVPSITVGTGLFVDGPDYRVPPVDLLVAASTTPEVFYRVEGNVRITLFDFVGNFPQLLFVTSLDDVAAAMQRAAQALNPDPAATVETTQTVTAIRVGTGANDTLRGIDGQNIEIEGGYGNDLFLAGAGADTMDGGQGRDTVSYEASGAAVAVNLLTGTGEGGDAEGDVLRHIEGIIGSAHDDLLTGSHGDDTLTGGLGADVIHGGDGNDSLLGSQGGDLITAGTGNDWIHGGKDDDTLMGGAGDDTVNGGQGLDEVHGNDGNDQLFGLSEDDMLYGGAGNDSLFGGDGNDLLTGGDGNDQLAGDAGDDILLGGNGQNTLSGGLGDDLLVGGAEADSLLGDAGQDTLDGGLGNDTLSGGDGNDLLSGREGADMLTGDAGDDLLDGGLGNDTLSGGDGADLLVGGFGDDSLLGGQQNDQLFGGDGNDWAHGGKDNDLLDGGAGLDTLDGGVGDDTVMGGTGADLLMGNTGDDSLFGNQDNDALFGGIGNDWLHGGQGNDTLTGGAGQDTLNGGQGADVFVFARADLNTGIDQIDSFAQGEDRIALSADLVTFLQSKGGTAADAVVWNGTTGLVSLNLAAVGLSGSIDLARVNSGGAALNLTVDDFGFM
ncbi:hypothetical protein GEU84_014590 [Fertoebacter nigrum]|uniref:Calcium-binding protein n=1 Tax=Fertoeibacter niger TaxID=2656921 RepID=A0A8X8H211_9RHOB|nr:calcium-binding protein [Fertoeibacter niger]NUB45625.1 hypothetical protein [Fertoeibacter niger]